MDIAKSVQEAMDLLKGSADDEVVAEDEEVVAGTADETIEEITEPPTSEEVPEKASAVEEKGNKLDIVKGSEMPSLESYVEADEFLKGIVDVVDQNITRVASAVERQGAATGKVIDVLKGLTDVVTSLQTRIDAFGSQPLPRRAVITKSEAEAAVVQHPSLGTGDENALSKGTILKALTEAVGKGKALVRDVTLMESVGGGAFSQEIPIEQILDRLSPQGQQVVQGLLADRR